MAVCSEIHTKHINTVCGQNVELLNVKLGLVFKYSILFFHLASLLKASKPQVLQYTHTQTRLYAPHFGCPVLRQAEQTPNVTLMSSEPRHMQHLLAPASQPLTA
jgi:predicted PP-loop superfamily ATPase